MDHPSEGALLGLIDRELPPEEDAAMREHLGSCSVCRAELHALQGESVALSGALHLLDRPPPTEQAWSAVRGRSRGALGAPLRRAAVLVLVAGGAASATVPGSPLRDWITDVWDRGAAETPQALPEAKPAVEPAAAPTAAFPPAGVALVPGTRPAVVSIVSEGVRPEVRVRLHGGDRLEVEAIGGDRPPRFRTSPDRVEVRTGGGEIHLLVPRQGSVRLEVNGEDYLVKHGDQLRFPGPAADASTAEVVFGPQP